MARTWLISSRGIAKKIKNAARFSNYQVRDMGTDAKRECPNCRYLIDNSDVSLEWPGLPAGVKFDPSDIQLLEHLAGKVGMNNSVPHMFIDEFIPTLEMEQGICYTHPENLPGVKKDGSSVHFFHRTSNAYATGHRKRRKIQSGCSISEERVRWHKTGKTKPVLENGIQMGWKKIMVLYRSSKRCCKPDKANWVMHQYHLGTVEEEEDGELVVSKIFYQQQLKQVDKSDTGPANENSDQWTVKTGPTEESDQWIVRTGPAEESDQWTVKTGPTTPKIITPQPPRTKKNPEHESDKHNHEMLPTLKEHDVEDGLPLPPLFVHGKDESINPSWWAGESQGIEEPNPNDIDESLLCHEVLDSFPPIEESFYLDNHNFYGGRVETNEGTANTGSGFSDLDNIVLDTPPDFQLSDLQFGSQDSITSWLDRL